MDGPLSQEELDRQADYLRSVGEPEAPRIPWPDLPEFMKNYWRELARGNAGAALG
jgi:hypothetical protein